MISKRDHADAAALAAERGDDARASRAWDDARQASEVEDDVREVAFEFPVENSVEQLNQELVEEKCEAPATGAVARNGSAVQAAHTTMLSVGATKHCLSRVHSLVEATRHIIKL